MVGGIPRSGIAAVDSHRIRAELRRTNSRKPGSSGAGATGYYASQPVPDGKRRGSGVQRGKSKDIELVSSLPSERGGGGSCRCLESGFLGKVSATNGGCSRQLALVAVGPPRGSCVRGLERGDGLFHTSRA